MDHEMAGRSIVKGDEPSIGRDGAAQSDRGAVPDLARLHRLVGRAGNPQPFLGDCRNFPLIGKVADNLAVVVPCLGIAEFLMALSDAEERLSRQRAILPLRDPLILLDRAFQVALHGFGFHGRSKSDLGFQL